MKKKKNIGSVVYWVIVFILLAIAGLTALSTLNIPGNYKLFVVQSGSMEPTLKTGSIVISKPEIDYSRGDIVTFNSTAGNKKSTVTHRIYSVNNENSQITFMTKGDANKAPDINKLTKSQIVGKTIFSVPYIGYPINFAKTQAGLIILIIIPAVIIIYSEILNIKNEAIKILKSRKQKLSVREKIEVAIGKEEIAIEKAVKEEIKKDIKKVEEVF